MPPVPSPPPRPRPSRPRPAQRAPLPTAAVLGGLLLALLLTAFAAPGLAAAPPADAARTAPLVGSWRATNYRSDGVVETGIRLTFTPDGRATLRNAEGESGTGTWRSTGPLRASFDIRTDTDFGYVLVHQDAVVGGGRFVGRGGGTGYTPDGTVIATSRSVIRAVRAGGQNAA